jgi:hypothetical protein
MYYKSTKWMNNNVEFISVVADLIDASPQVVFTKFARGT